MKTQEFLKIAPKLKELNLFYNLKKGEHGLPLLGFSYFGSTESHYKYIWRKYGNISNILIFDTSERTNDKLKEAGITEFYAKKTKSGKMCRLYEVKL